MLNRRDKATKPIRPLVENRDLAVVDVNTVAQAARLKSEHEIGENHEACLRRMQQSHVRHLLVLPDGRLAGILSMRDFLALEIDERDEAINLLNSYVHYIPADLSPTRAGS